MIAPPMNDGLVIFIIGKQRVFVERVSRFRSLLGEKVFTRRFSYSVLCRDLLALQAVAGL
jgi:hypothetical protein